MEVWTQHNSAILHTHRYDSSTKGLPDEINVNGILFGTVIKITLYKQGSWASSFNKSKVLFKNSSTSYTNIAGSDNTVSAFNF